MAGARRMAALESHGAHDALGLAGLVAAGEVSPGELLDEALARTVELNPLLNAVPIVCEDAARRSIRAGLPDGPLKGVPFLLKDLGAEAVDYPSHNGSALLEGTTYPVNSTLVDRLLGAGLVVFGRTASPEGGIGPVTESAVYGRPTRNPWNPDHTSGGSSGGAGAAVGAGIVPAAHGSDGGGSVRIPASSCGLFGFKPTRARLPDGPYVGESWAGMAIDGFLTRSVRDTAALLDIAQGPDIGMPYRAPPLAGTFAEAARRAPGRLRIACCPRTFGGDPTHPECAAAVEAAARLFADLGHEVEEASPAADHPGMMLAWTRIVACGTALWVRQALRRKGRDLRPGDIEGVTQGACELAREISGDLYLESVTKIHSYGREMERFFVEDGPDILVSSTLAEPPAKVGRFAPTNPDFVDYRMGKAGIFPYSPFTVCFNASGQPAASLPLHWTGDGLPVGVHVAARFGGDELLMSLCAQAEQARPWADIRPKPLSSREEREGNG